MIRESTLSLLVLRIITDHHDFTMALDDLALVANFLYGRFDFHSLFHLSRVIGEPGRQPFVLHVIRPFVGS